MFDRVIFEPYLRSQTLINIHEIFHNISHVDLIYVLRSGVESFSHTLHLPYFSYGTYGNVLCHHNRHLMAHFEFLHYSEVICLPLNIIEKLYWHHLFEKLGEAETIITSISLQYPLILKNNIDYSSKMGPPPFFHSDINPVLCHVLVHSVDMFWL